MAAITLNEEQTRLLRICVKHSEPLKPNWEKVAEEAGLVSTSAASQRWSRLYKLLMGDEKPSTSSKGKGSTRKNEAASTQKKTPNKKATTPKGAKTSEEDMSDEVDGDTTMHPSTQTPKKRARDGTSNLGSDMEDGTPTKIMKTEVKDEDEN